MRRSRNCAGEKGGNNLLLRRGGRGHGLSLIHISKKVKETEAALEKCRKTTGQNSEESKKLEAQLNYQKTALVKTEQELNKTAADMEKAGRAADDMGKEIEESGQQAESAGGRFSGLGGILGGLGGAMAKGVTVIGTAAAAIGTAVVAGLAYTVSQADEAKGALNDFCASTGTATEEADQYKQVMENIYCLLYTSRCV